LKPLSPGVVSLRLRETTDNLIGHLGTWFEDVARMVSGGIKPGNGVDLQTQDTDGHCHLEGSRLPETGWRVGLSRVGLSLGALLPAEPATLI
jgi:hypothetical protein